MLKEKEELGKAILEAIIMNGYTKADAARRFNVKPPSVTGWIQTGRISKGKFDELRRWLSKTPASHWGIDEESKNSTKYPKELSQQEVRFLDAYRKQPSEEIRLKALDILSIGVNAPAKRKGRTTPDSTEQAA